MKLTSKTILAALAVSLLSSGAALAGDLVRRIDHPNGPATYVAVPADSRGATIGVLAGERSFGRRDEAVRSGAGLTDSENRTLVPLHQGRGQTLYISVQR